MGAKRRARPAFHASREVLDHHNKHSRETYPELPRKKRREFVSETPIDAQDIIDFESKRRRAVRRERKLLKV